MSDEQEKNTDQIDEATMSNLPKISLVPRKLLKRRMIKNSIDDSLKPEVLVEWEGRSINSSLQTWEPYSTFNYRDKFADLSLLPMDDDEDSDTDELEEGCYSVEVRFSSSINISFNPSFNPSFIPLFNLSFNLSFIPLFLSIENFVLLDRS